MASEAASGAAPRPLFLVSLPRSGSTLLQRMLAVSPDVASASEPWLMLPLAYMFEPEGALAEYGHRTLTDAVADLGASLPGGRADLVARVSDFARGVYRGLAEGAGRPEAAWFLDKTPRYYLIVPFLAEAFPDAKFLFLFRNPLAVLASTLRTWHEDRFGPGFNGSYVDLHEGPRRMAEGWKAVGDRGLAVRYERLVTDPEGVLGEICDHLGIGFDEAMVSAYRDVALGGRMGDPDGIGRYAAVSTESLERWRTFVRNHFRRAYARRYLRDMDDATLAAFGVDRDTLQGEINGCAVSWRGDVVDAAGAAAMSVVRLANSGRLRRAYRALRKGERILPLG